MRYTINVHVFFLFNPKLWMLWFHSESVIAERWHAVVCVLNSYWLQIIVSMNLQNAVLVRSVDYTIMHLFVYIVAEFISKPNIVHEYHLNMKIHMMYWWGKSTLFVVPECSESFEEPLFNYFPSLYCYRYNFNEYTGDKPHFGIYR
jgi:hypothetical protein